MEKNRKIILIAAISTGLIGGILSKFLIAFESKYLASHTISGQNMVVVVILTPVIFLLGLYFLNVAVCKIFIK